MGNSMTYKGYNASIDYCSEDDLLVGSVIGIQDSLNFHGTTLEEITNAFHSCIDNYLEMCKALGRNPDKVYKGSFNIRIAPATHRNAAIAAECMGITLNQFVQEAIEEKLNPNPHETIVVMLPQMTQTATVVSKRNEFSDSGYQSEPAINVPFGGYFNV